MDMCTRQRIRCAVCLRSGRPVPRVRACPLQEMDNHLDSYDHHHKKRLMEMKARSTRNQTTSGRILRLLSLCHA